MANLLQNVSVEGGIRRYLSVRQALQENGQRLLDFLSLLRTFGLVFATMNLFRRFYHQHSMAAYKSNTPLPPLKGNETIAELYQRIVHRYADPTSLASLNHIPEELQDDPYLKNYTCAITMAPIRNPAVDPTNRKTLYERDAILRWLEANRTSPTTRGRLEQRQIKIDVFREALIRSRLKFHEDRIREWLKLTSENNVNRNAAQQTGE